MSGRDQLRWEYAEHPQRPASCFAVLRVEARGETTLVRAVLGGDEFVVQTSAIYPSVQACCLSKVTREDFDRIMGGGT